MTPAALRRAIHAASGAAALLIHVAPAVAYRAILAALAAAALALDVARMRRPLLHDALARALRVFRPWERRRVSGASWLLLGYTAAAFLPARDAAAAGILVGALADPAAAIVGGRLGGGRAKSWPGTLAALATGCAALAVSGLPVAAVVAGGVAGAVAERWSGGMDDNLLVPPAVGATVTLFA